MGSRRTSIALTLVTLLAAASLAAGYGMGGLWAGVAAAVAAGGLWLLGQRLSWGWTATWGLALFVGGAAYGVLRGLGVGWMLLGVTAALTAWDLDDFARRLRSVDRVEGGPALGRRRLGRLLVVDSLGLGLALAAVALEARIGLGFCPAVLLAALAAAGLSLVVRSLSIGGRDDRQAGT